MTEEDAKLLLDRYGQHQPKTDAWCPRCGALMLGKTAGQALSRYANIMVCPGCGEMEAFEQAGIVDRIPLTDWIAIKHPEMGGGEWEA